MNIFKSYSNHIKFVFILVLKYLILDIMEHSKGFIAINIIINTSDNASKSTIMCVMPVHYEHYAW